MGIIIKYCKPADILIIIVKKIDLPITLSACHKILRFHSTTSDYSRGYFDSAINRIDSNYVTIASINSYKNNRQNTESAGPVA
jgi:hypothetical protein